MYTAPVHAGIASSDYGSLVARHAERGVYHATASALSVACGRLSYSFGLRGPSVSVDTACSASLVGLHMAATGLQAGEAQLSYANGEYHMCTQGVEGTTAALVHPVWLQVTPWL